MHVTTDSKDLIDALKASAYAGKTTMPVLQHVLLRAQGDEILVEATDLEARTAIAIPAQVQEPGSALLPADKLSAAAAGDGTVDIRADGRVTRGRSRFQLAALDAADFPEGQGAERFEPVQADAIELGAAIQQAGYAADEGDPRPACKGVVVRNGYVDSTDGKRMSRIAVDYAGPTILIPSKQLPRLRGLLGAGAELSVANVHSGRAGLLRITSGTHTLILTCIDAQPLGVDAVIGSVDIGGTGITVRRKPLLDAVRRFAPFVNVFAKGERGLVLVMEKGQLSVRESVDGLNSEDVTGAVEKAGSGDFIAGLSNRYLSDVLGAIDDDLVDIYLDKRICTFLPQGGDISGVAHLVATQER